MTLRLEGDADLGKDYTLQAMQSTGKAGMKVTAPEGRGATDLILKALDDLLAEADETVLLILETDEGYRVDKVMARYR